MTLLAKEAAYVPLHPLDPCFGLALESCCDPTGAEAVGTQEETVHDDVGYGENEEYQ